MPEPRLVLWDIDHTLLETGPIGRELFAEAFRHATGLQMREQARLDGRTEPETFRDTVELHGAVPDHNAFAQFAASLAEGYDRRRADLMNSGRTLPFARQALESLAAMPDLIQTVVTGNIRQVALIKLDTFGLLDILHPEIGAYGDEAATRGDLVHLSRVRAANVYNQDFGGRRTIVIGDTSADIRAAHFADARAIAISTGHFTSQDLTDAGADQVLDTLKCVAESRLIRES